MKLCLQSVLALLAISFQFEFCESFTVFRNRIGFRNLARYKPRTVIESAHSDSSKNQVSNDGQNDLIDLIEQKEREFQSELEKLLGEAKANNAAVGKGNGIENFSNEDLAKAILEMQQLKKNDMKSKSDGINENKNTESSEAAVEVVKLIIPPGLVFCFVFPMPSIFWFKIPPE